MPKPPAANEEVKEESWGREKERKSGGKTTHLTLLSAGPTVVGLRYEVKATLSLLVLERLLGYFLKVICKCRKY